MFFLFMCNSCFRDKECIFPRNIIVKSEFSQDIKYEVWNIKRTSEVCGITIGFSGSSFLIINSLLFISVTYYHASASLTFDESLKGRHYTLWLSIMFHFHLTAIPWYVLLVFMYCYFCSNGYMACFIKSPVHSYGTVTEHTWASEISVLKPV